MAFVHHQPRQQRREHQYHDSPSNTYSTRQHEREVPQDWSIVFPGRTRQASPNSPTIQIPSHSCHTSHLTPSTPCTDDTDDTDPLALTLPPLHDGTGRFFPACPLSPASTDAALQYSNEEDHDHISDAHRSESVFPPESVSSGTDSQLDADEELGFGSGSDFDFESDAVASSHPSHSSVRRGAARTASKRRPSKLSHHVSNGSDDEDDRAHSQSHSHLLGSKTWSLLARSNALERVLESPGASTQLHSSAHSRRKQDRSSAHTANHLPVVFTSGSEQEDNDAQSAIKLGQLSTPHNVDLANSNLAASAGLSHLDQSDHLVRRPKRRHRRSIAGRSSKRSNTSQSLLSIDYELRVLNASRHPMDDAETRRSSTRATRMIQGHPSKTTRVIGSILRKVFDLESEVLDAFLDEEARSDTHQQSTRRPGFAFESSDAPLASAPLCDATSMMLDGRSEQERYQGAACSDTEVEEAALASVTCIDPSTSPLFSNAKTVHGEESSSDSSSFRLTEAALLSRNSPSARGTLMEPTTMEALSAFMNTMVMPVPIPFRLLGALLGWSSIWSSGSSTSAKIQRREQQGDDEEGEASEAAREEERKYRYERLLSAQQAKAWSRRYRGILFANVDDEEPSPDVPELWRGEEHPAIADHHD
ncbi:uncharacterized protein MEPE_06377 [Melanopsichium pennsylvanicum]|uniref:Uncharacterized protein n=2 Tax=Melanopsichium pennsylvanicum TaxID=63383 RepID=A0AAJ4XSL9_9BASI|nr:putative protein [Melanopsichium pennsylvanicum 4]SNX87667.1 uncharacterized protein MEPE_06377 [Melanopsichium pennsylvanicum]